MRRRQPLPRIWLMTDERMGDALWLALERLPRGSGIVFRHYALDRAERAGLFRHVAAIAARRRLVLLVGGPLVGKRWQRSGRHGACGPGLCSMPAHSVREGVTAARRGADLVFVSPVYPTRSHPGARTLGPHGFARIARTIAVPVIALGGMNAERARRLCALGAWGWAAIDAWTAGPD